MKRSLISFFFSCLVVALVGQSPAVAEKWRDKTLRQWQGRLEKIHRQLEAGSFRAAERSSTALAAEMAQRIVVGGNSYQVLALVTSYRAVAYAGLEQWQEALWYWQVAQNLSPELRRGAHFPDFGPAGEYLGARNLRRAGEAPEDLASAFVPPEDPAAAPPVPLLIPRPRAPHGLALKGWYTDRMAVEVVVDGDGRIRSPVVLAGEMPAKIYLGLEALRRWRLEPARSGGRPVATLLTVDEFTVPRSFAFLLVQVPELQEIHALLAARRWQQAATAAASEIASVQRKPGDRGFLGVLTAARALAEAGLGRDDDALRSWHQAQALAGALGWFDFAAYGATGRLLDQNASRCRLSMPDVCDLTTVTPPGQEPAPVSTEPLRVEGNVRKPSRLFVSQPRYSAESRKAGLQGAVVLHATLDRYGLVRNLNVVAGVPGLSELVLEAASSWRFLPATLHGVPVDVYYMTTTSFRIDR